MPVVIPHTNAALKRTVNLAKYDNTDSREAFQILVKLIHGSSLTGSDMPALALVS